MNPVMCTTPPIWCAEILSCNVLRCISDTFLPEMLAIKTANAMTPIPPIWINVKMIPCPKYDQYVAVSCTINPVTQTADVEVNKASANDVHSLLCEAIGSVSNKAPARITPANPRMMI